MKARVRQRPLLIESYNSAAARMEARRKALIAIKESLDKAGIQDQARFFDPQVSEVNATAMHMERVKSHVTQSLITSVLCGVCFCVLNRSWQISICDSNAAD